MGKREEREARRTLAIQRFLAKRGYRLGRTIGYGAEGSVYRIVGKPRWVCKISHTPCDHFYKYELRFASFLWRQQRRGRPTPGFPAIRLVRRFRNRYTIVRENIPGRRVALDTLFALEDRNPTGQSKDVVETIAWLRKHRWLWRDSHGDNVGRHPRTGRLLIRDLGFFFRSPR